MFIEQRRKTPAFRYGDISRLTHESPDRYELVSEAKEDIELLKAAELVIKALETRKKIGK